MKKLDLDLVKYCNYLKYEELDNFDKNEIDDIINCFCLLDIFNKVDYDTFIRKLSYLLCIVSKGEIK